MEVIKNLSMIVAAGLGNEIGKDNKLLWHLPNDLKRFKTITLNKTIIMGRNTYLSLPFRPLPQRDNIVLTGKEDVGNRDFIGAKLYHNIDDVLDMVRQKTGEVFIVGGASVYEQFLPYTNLVYLTRVMNVFDADTYFPILPDDEWVRGGIHFNSADEKHLYNYSYQLVMRK